MTTTTTAMSLAIGLLLGGCVMAADGNDPAETIGKSAAVTRNGKGPTREEQIASCKVDCERKYTPCAPEAPADKPQLCNPDVPAEASNGPLIATCKRACEAIEEGADSFKRPTNPIAIDQAIDQDTP